MSEITWRQLRDELARRDREGGPIERGGVFLLFGEELICRRCVDTLVTELLGPEEPAEFHHEVLDGAVHPLATALERVSTFSLLGGTKLVTLLEPGVLHPRQGARARWLQSARTAMTAGDKEGAARHLLRMLSASGLQPGDLTGPDRDRALAALSSESRDHAWLAALAEHCRDMTPPAAAGGPEEVELLAAALSKGLPRGNHLILLAVAVDRRGKVFKTLAEHAVVVDCGVPGGERRAERGQRQEMLRHLANQVLAASGKQIAPEALRLLEHQAGHDLRAFQGELEKLAAYVGRRDNIRPADVEAVLSTRRSDPLFDLTGAIGERDTAKAVTLLASLLRRRGEEAVHPLQILASLTNHVRRLMVARDALDRSVEGAPWPPESSFNEFQQRLLPALERYDQELCQLLAGWESAGVVASQSSPQATAGKKSKTTRRATGDSDLLLMRKGANPYALYMLCRQAARYDLRELITAYTHLSRADRRMKRSGLDPLLLLTDVVLKICAPPQPGGFSSVKRTT
jgi:DNA polymerase-3 subunit delta